jgi:hypothetical protein
LVFGLVKKALRAKLADGHGGRAEHSGCGEIVSHRIGHVQSGVIADLVSDKISKHSGTGQDVKVMSFHGLLCPFRAVNVAANAKADCQADDCGNGNPDIFVHRFSM